MSKIIQLFGEVGVRTYISRSVSHKWQGVCLHHSWRPTTRDYKGIATVEAIKRYHVQTKGWRDIAYHFLVGPDGAIWTGRPLDMTGGHAVISRQDVLKRFKDVNWPNKNLVGVCAIGDYDTEEVSEPLAKSLRLLWRELQVLKGQDWTSYRHRDFSPKTCPGKNLALFDWEPKLTQVVENALVGPSEWARETWQRFKDLGITDGKDPLLPASREQVVMMIDRAFEKLRKEVN